MAHWDLFLPGDTICEARLVADGRAESEPVQVPLRVMREVVRLAKEHELALLAGLPVASGAGWACADGDFARLEAEWASLVEHLSDPRHEEAMDPFFALVQQGQADPRAGSLEVRAL